MATVDKATIRVLDMTDKRSQSLGYRFALLYRLNSFFIAGQLRRINISRSQVPFMAELLNAESPMTQDQLSYDLEIDKAATARTLDLLEKKSLIHREVNPENRRQKMVSATVKAKKFKQEFFNILKNSHDIFLKGFSPDEKNQVFKLMDRMMENARKEKYENK